MLDVEWWRSMAETVTKKEIAREYRVSERTVTNWMYRDKKITFLKIGRMVRFHLPTVDRELKQAGLISTGLN